MFLKSMLGFCKTDGHGVRLRYSRNTCVLMAPTSSITPRSYYLGPDKMVFRVVIF